MKFNPSLGRSGDVGIKCGGHACLEGWDVPMLEVAAFQVHFRCCVMFNFCMNCSRRCMYLGHPSASGDTPDTVASLV